MNYSDFVLLVNGASIFMLVVMAVLLLAVTRFKGEGGYVAAIIVAPNVPVYLYNLGRLMEWQDFTMFMTIPSFSFNTTLMPLLWLFILRNFKPGFRFKPVYLLHFLPAITIAVILLLLPRQVWMDNILVEMGGKDAWIGNINLIVIIAQILTYFPAIFLYIRKTKHYYRDNYSDAEYLLRVWIERFMVLFAALFVVVELCYIIWPRSDEWLIQVLNVIAMFYLAYNALKHPQFMNYPVSNGNGKDKDLSPASITDSEQMREYCEKIVEYLTASKAFLRYDFSLSMLSVETGIAPSNISRAINGHLNKKFFDLINEMRIEEAKIKFLSLKDKNHTVGSVAGDCGFRSRSSFFAAFKKVEGKTPLQWLKTIS